MMCVVQLTVKKWKPLNKKLVVYNTFGLHQITRWVKSLLK